MSSYWDEGFFRGVTQLLLLPYPSPSDVYEGCGDVGGPNVVERACRCRVYVVRSGGSIRVSRRVGDYVGFGV
jgi:hypothetical protein